MLLRYIYFVLLSGKTEVFSLKLIPTKHAIFCLHLICRIKYSVLYQIKMMIRLIHSVFGIFEVALDPKLTNN